MLSLRLLLGMLEIFLVAHKWSFSNLCMNGHGIDDDRMNKFQIQKLIDTKAQTSKITHIEVDEDIIPS